MIRFALFLALVAFTARAEVARLSPAFEGLYEIASVKCLSRSCAGVSSFGRLTVMDVGKPGVELTFHNTKIGTPVYRLVVNRMEKDGAHLEADAFASMGRAIEWVGDIDNATGALTGTLRIAGAAGDVQMEGRRIASPSSFYQPQAVSDMLGVLEIQGTFNATRFSTREFIIRSTLSGTPVVVATWLLDFGARIDFNDSEFLPEQGVLLLYSRGNMGTLKWTVALRRNAQGVVEGKVAAFSSVNAGQAYGLDLRRPQRGGKR